MSEEKALPAAEDFYLRYYVGHSGVFGHEFLEFELQPNGRLRYANNSNYRKDVLIRKEVHLTQAVVDEFKRIVEQSSIMAEDDKLWPMPNDDGRQEIEIVLRGQHISFVSAKFGSMADIEKCEAAASLKLFYFLVQDLKSFVISLISLHFKIKPT